MATAKEICDVMKAHPDADKWSVSELPGRGIVPRVDFIAATCTTTYGHTIGMGIEPDEFPLYPVDEFSKAFNAEMEKSRARHDSGECGC